MTELTFEIVWPQKRTVSAAQIKSWYDDALADGEVLPGRTDPFAMARELDDVGLITLKYLR